jgi:hypothetical protein
MGRIILTIPGTWSNRPDIDAGPLEVDFGPANHGLVDEMTDFAGPAEALDGDDLHALRRHAGVLYLSAEFEAPGEARYARAAAKVLFSLLGRGKGEEAERAVGAYVETALKVFAPSSLAGMPEDEAISLFHLFVEVYGDKQAIYTEGMQAFDLPDVEVPYASKDEVGPAQAAAFALAARMVCEGVRPAAGHPFRTSESAPLFRVEPGPIPPSDAALAGEGDDHLFVNDRGRWRLVRV